MYCTKCGVELRENDAFCSQCGHQRGGAPIAPTAPPPSASPRPLMLDKRNKKIAGVCAGFARYFDMDVVLMRVLWLGLSLGTGVGFLVYLAAWIVIPSDQGLDPREMAVQVPQTN